MLAHVLDRPPAQLRVARRRLADRARGATVAEPELVLHSPVQAVSVGLRRRGRQTELQSGGPRVLLQQPCAIAAAHRPAIGSAMLGAKQVRTHFVAALGVPSSDAARLCAHHAEHALSLHTEFRRSQHKA